MTNENILRLRRIYAVILSISIVFAGICLMAGCLSIYNSGEQPYSREAVAETFSGIAMPVYICLALTVIGFILEYIFPENTKPKSNSQNNSYILARLAAKKDFGDAETETLAAISKERKSRKLHSLISAMLMGFAGVIFLVYSLNSGNYGTDINEAVINAMKWLIPCLAVPFVYAVFAVYRNGKSIKREIRLLKSIPNAENTEKADVPSSYSGNKTAAALRCVLLLVGVAILIFGYVSGGTADVLTKAINICTECIGLG